MEREKDGEKECERRKGYVGCEDYSGLMRTLFFEDTFYFRLGKS